MEQQTVAQSLDSILSFGDFFLYDHFEDDGTGAHWTVSLVDHFQWTVRCFSFHFFLVAIGFFFISFFVYSDSRI